jgi:hypothetical protein
MVLTLLKKLEILADAANTMRPARRPVDRNAMRAQAD